MRTITDQLREECRDSAVDVFYFDPFRSVRLKMAPDRLRRLKEVQNLSRTEEDDPLMEPIQVEEV